MNEAISERSRWVAAADMLELLARCFSFPEEETVYALASGAVAEDAQTCGSILEIADSDFEEALIKISSFRDADALYCDMRKGFSSLYLVPGACVPVFPYEGPFRALLDGQSEIPSLFVNGVAKDVVRTMRHYGLEPDASRHEPADSIWFELAFCSYLCGLLAQSIEEGDEQVIAERRAALTAFSCRHVETWMVAFMESTREKARDYPYAYAYADLAQLGSAALKQILALCK